MKGHTVLHLNDGDVAGVICQISFQDPDAGAGRIIIAHAVKAMEILSYQGIPVREWALSVGGGDGRTGGEHIEERV